MRAFSLIVRIILILFIVRMIVMFFRGRIAAARRPPVPPSRTTERVGGDLVRDSQCGTYVPRVNAIGALVAGKMEYFCSATCRDKALQGRH